MSYLALAKQVGAQLRQAPSVARIPAPPTPVPALCQILRRWYALTAREAEGTLPTPEEVRTLLSEIRRRWDDAGPAFAEAVHRQEAWAYYQETQRCATCGEWGALHPTDGAA